jgi:hypothetical protein
MRGSGKFFSDFQRLDVQILRIPILASSLKKNRKVVQALRQIQVRFRPRCHPDLCGASETRFSLLQLPLGEIDHSKGIQNLSRKDIPPILFFAVSFEALRRAASASLYRCCPE